MNVRGLIELLSEMPEHLTVYIAMGAGDEGFVTEVGDVRCLTDPNERWAGLDWSRVEITP